MQTNDLNNSFLTYSKQSSVDETSSSFQIYQNDLSFLSSEPYAFSWTNRGIGIGGDLNDSNSIDFARGMPVTSDYSQIENTTINYALNDSTFQNLSPPKDNRLKWNIEQEQHISPNTSLSDETLYDENEGDIEDIDWTSVAQQIETALRTTVNEEQTNKRVKATVQKNDTGNRNKGLPPKPPSKMGVTEKHRLITPEQQTENDENNCLVKTPTKKPDFNNFKQMIQTLLHSTQSKVPIIHPDQNSNSAARQIRVLAEITELNRHNIRNCNHQTLNIQYDLLTSQNRSNQQRINYIQEITPRKCFEKSSKKAKHLTPAQTQTEENEIISTHSQLHTDNSQSKQTLNTLNNVSTQTDCTINRQTQIDNDANLVQFKEFESPIKKQKLNETNKDQKLLTDSEDKQDYSQALFEPATKTSDTIEHLFHQVISCQHQQTHLLQKIKKLAQINNRRSEIREKSNYEQLSSSSVDSLSEVISSLSTFYLPMENGSQSPISLQDAFQSKKQNFLLHSQQRLANIKQRSKKYSNERHRCDLSNIDTHSSNTKKKEQIVEGIVTIKNDQRKRKLNTYLQQKRHQQLEQTRLYQLKQKNRINARNYGKSLKDHVVKTSSATIKSKIGLF
ncbi:unnamed protein product [Didymodactylos carnosus]|uniref:Uncharacterized protein n=1 Tax=Didymodactylos carnosus TaxID=1234261 RepID=A0A813Z441_9BILA|nr:unnamed protein product [Didymodactylos carnosus]CAF1155833.1 unnamed protein product [Didymodactylos carnosus]CAF3677042.1 unnamed protein product [Didymodactylos carnosus]CAF3966960.1 unnamed protein product [Didymodactylos carnosus]